MKPLEFNGKVDFLLLLARSLQQCGAAAHHLERALYKAGKGLGLESEYLAFPTGLLGSFRAPKPLRLDQEGTDAGDSHHHRSIVLRFAPGQINLSKLSSIDEAADQVLDGQLSLDAGMQKMDAINQQGDDYHPFAQVLAYAMSSGGFATALKGSWLDFSVAVGIGFCIGLAQLVSRRLQVVDQLFAAIASCFAAVVALSMSHLYPSLSVDLVILAGIVVLLPGLTLIIAFVELSTKNLVAGTARLSGAFVDLMKLVFTVAITKKLMGVTVPSPTLDLIPLPPWTEIPGVFAMALGFVILFRVRPRHALSAFTFSVISYSLARWGGARLGIELSFFATGALVSLSSNFFARLLKRPGMITLLPGIALIVPGSINYRGFTALFQNNVIDTVQTSISVVIIAVSLVAGLFFGNTIIPPRRSL